MVNLYRYSQYIAWGAMIVLLPITSLEVLARWTGASTVALPAAIPLLWLVLVWFLPYLFRRGNLPRQAVPFLVFLVIALIAAAGAFFIDVPPFKGASILSEERSALLTLGVGAAFYLVMSTWPRSSGRLHLSLKLINWSGVLLLGWSLVQTYFILFQGSRYPHLVVEIQDWMSQTGLFGGRVTGFAYEPSWLAHQLNVFYLPFWLAASAARYSAHRRRLLGLSFENILLALGFAMLFLSFSRIGLLAALLMVAFLILPRVYHAVRGAAGRLLGGFDSLKKPLRYLLNGGILVLIAAGSALALVGLVYAVSRFDVRLAALFENLQWDGNGIYSIANQLAFAERVVYWAAGWRIFNDFPLLGVGLGNAGFFFLEKMPPFGWALWEVSQLFYRLAYLPNTKSMWARLLAETGWIGFSVFITWLYVLWRSAKAAYTEASPLIKTVALAGMLALVAYLIEGFSLDSFAMPYLWASMGLLTAGVAVGIGGEENG